MPLGGLIPYGPTKKTNRKGFGMNTGGGLSAMLSAPQTRTDNGPSAGQTPQAPPAPPPPAPPNGPSAGQTPQNPSNTPTGTTPPPPFTDVGGSPHAGNIDVLRQLGYFAGTGGGQFNPQGAMLREHMGPLLSQALGSPVNMQIPTGQITRGDFALLLNQLLGSSLGQGTAGGSGFNDVMGAQGAAANRLNRLNITAGTGGGRFNPTGVLTREQFASLLANAMRVQRNTGNLM